VLDHSLHLTFLAVFILSVLTVALAAIVPQVTFAPRPAEGG
jgi:hypothetical protein